MNLYRIFFKRFLDLVISGVALILLSPVFLVIAILVRTKLGSPIFFSQSRPGKNEKIFKMYKFRSMIDDTDENGNLLPDDKRLPAFGKKLRSTSLDELPELWNIFKGDMSLIGPRPLLIRYLPFYTNYEKRRHNVRPGLSGLSQVSGRNNLGWDERLSLDVKYVENISLMNDISIIMRTIQKVIMREDIASGEELILKDLDDERKGNN